MKIKRRNYKKVKFWCKTSNKKVQIAFQILFVLLRFNSY